MLARTPILTVAASLAPPVVEVPPAEAGKTFKTITRTFFNGKAVTVLAADTTATPRKEDRS